MPGGLLGLLARRLVVAVPVIVVVSFAVFMLVSLVPGDPAVTLAGGLNATPQRIAQVRAQLHLNDSLLTQYGIWASHAVQLNLGRSFASGTSVASGIASALPVTLGLVFAAAIIAVLIGVPLGIASAVWSGRLIDGVARVLASLGMAIPGFWLGVLLVSLFSVDLRLLPPTGYTSFAVSVTGWLRTIILPASALGFYIAAVIARQLRGSLIDVLNSNYIRTAWAKGASPQRVIVHHALKNAALPAITVLGVSNCQLLGGAVIIETIFSLPGLGTYMFQAITNHDLPAIQGVLLVFVIGQLVISFLVDLSYGYLNPRIRVG